MVASQEFRTATLKTLKSVVASKKYKIQSEELNGNDFNGTQLTVVEPDGKNIFSVHKIYVKSKTFDGKDFTRVQYSLLIDNKSYFGDFNDSELEDLFSYVQEAQHAMMKENDKKQKESVQKAHEKAAMDFLAQYTI